MFLGKVFYYQTWAEKSFFYQWAARIRVKFWLSNVSALNEIQRLWDQGSRCASIILLTKFVEIHSVHKSLKMHTQCLTNYYSYIPRNFVQGAHHLTVHSTGQLQNLDMFWEHCVSSAIKREILAWKCFPKCLCSLLLNGQNRWLVNDSLTPA